MKRKATFGLIDAGSSRALNEGAWFQVLTQRGITELKWIGITHLDEDHYGGITHLAKIVPIGCVATSEDQLLTEKGQRFTKKMRELGITVKNWQSGCVPFLIYDPAKHPFLESPPTQTSRSSPIKQPETRRKRFDLKFASSTQRGRANFFQEEVFDSESEGEDIHTENHSRRATLGKRLLHLDTFRRKRKKASFVTGRTFRTGRKRRSYHSARKTANASMSALLVPLSQGGFYLNMGDADTNQERIIGNWLLHLASHSPELAHLINSTPRILKISHHGSSSSTDPEVIKTIRPTITWISAGSSNRYGHPSAKTLLTLIQARVPLYRTDKIGRLKTPGT